MIRTVFIAGLAVCVAGTAMFRLYTEHRVRTEEARISRLVQHQDVLRAELDRLRFEVEVLESAPRLNELSAERLPLAPGSPRQMADGDILRDVIDPAARLEIAP